MRRARVVLALAVLLTLAAGVASGVLADRLSSGGFDVPGSESMRQRALVERASGVSPGAGILVLVETPAGPRSPAARARVAAVVTALSREAIVARVRTPYQPGGGALVARGGDRVLVEARFGPSSDDARMRAAARVSTAVAPLPGVRVGGAAAIFQQITTMVREDLTRAELIALPLLFVLSLWVFRGLVAALVMPLMGGMVIALAFAAVGVINLVTTMSIFSANLIVAIGLGLAVDYSLLMITRFRLELGRGRDRAAALAETMRTSGVSVAYSALTVAAALAGLMVFPMNFLFSMGLGGLIVALLAGTASLVVLPAALWLLGPRINALAPGRWQRPAAAESSGGAWYRLSRAVLRRPLVTAVVTSAVLLVLATPVLKIHFIPIDSSVLPASADARAVSDIATREFPGGDGAPIGVAQVLPGAPAASARAARECARRMSHEDGVAAVTPPARDGGDVWSFAVMSRDASLSDASVGLVERLRDVRCDGDVLVGGVAADFIDQRAALARGLPLAVGIIALVTVAALFLMTGSVVLPLKAVVMNVLSIAATIGIVVWVFQEGHLAGLLHFDPAGGIGLTQPMLLGAVAFGLSTDYAVFLLSRIRELKLAGRTNDEAIAEGLQHTGRVITAAAILFAFAVGAFATSRVIVLKEIGLGTALAVLIDASIVRALLVPATMGVLGEANWWAPRLLRRLHDRVGVSDG